MKQTITILAVATMLLASVGQSGAGTIAGPSSFGVVGGTDTSWGIQFTALQGATLTGFDYHHNPTTFGNPFTGTISLNDTTASTNVYSTNYAANSPAVISYTGLSVALISGHVYQLVASSSIVSGANDEVYQYLSPFTSDPGYPVSNSEISVTQGVFDQNPGFQEANAWGAFTNIQTIASVPEPSAFALAGIGVVLGAGFGWRRSSKRAA